jgi:tetratricopeptide (TPR) repeat protein
VEIYTQAFDPEHYDVARSLTGLSVMYFFQGRYAEAEHSYEQAMHLWKQHFQARSPLRADVTDMPEDGSAVQEQSSGAVQHFLASIEEELGRTHEDPEVAVLLTRVANAYLNQQHYAQAEILLWRAFDMVEKALGKEHLKTVYCLGNLARLYHAQKQYVFAEFFYMRALQIALVTFKMRPTGTLMILENYRQLLEETGREQDALEVMKRLNEFKNL